MKHSLRSNIKYIYQHVFHYNKKIKVMLLTIIISSILIPILGTVIPSIVVWFITEGYGIKEFLYVLGGIFILYSFLLFIKQYFSNIVEYENVLVRLKEFYVGLSEKLMTTDYTNVEPQEKQVIIQKAMSSLTSNWVGVEFMMKNTPIFIINIIGLIIYSAFISSLHFSIIVVLLVMTALNYLLNLYAQRYEEKKKKDYSKVDKQINYLYDHSTSLINGKDVRMYKMKEWFADVFEGLIKKRVQWSKRIEYRYYLPFVTDNLLLFIRDIIAYGILINLVLNNQINIATFTLYVGIIAGFTTWLHNSVTAYSNLKRANIGVNDYRNYMNIKDVFKHHGGCALPTNEEFPLDIEFKNVSFKYPGATEDTLKNLNFKIDKGCKVALVGNNGAGKTTLVKLLTGLYHPTEGEILINGKPIRDYNLEEYHELVGAVFQEVEILAFNVAKNVAVTVDGDIDYSRVWRSLELAGLKDKVDSLKDKENTFLTQQLDPNGILLSGGEMQKLMLARALYKDAPIMILDEPTAALDPLAEAELYEKYNDLTKEKTSLFISHRLSSTKFCDRILFLEQGRIVEDGTHDELIKNEGSYAHMFNVQSHYYKDEVEVDDHE